MHRAALIFMAILISGCATRTQLADVAKVDWQSPTGKHYAFSSEIRREVESSLFSSTATGVFRLFANGRKIIEDGIHPTHYSGVFGGAVDGMSVAVTCSSMKRSDYWTDVSCELSVDGKPAGVLRM